MLRDGEILLRPLALADEDNLAQLANNKKIWDNLRDYFPHPYTRQVAALFIKQTQQ